MVVILGHMVRHVQLDTTLEKGAPALRKDSTFHLTISNLNFSSCDVTLSIGNYGTPVEISPL